MSAEKANRAAETMKTFRTAAIRYANVRAAKSWIYSSTFSGKPA